MTIKKILLKARLTEEERLAVAVLCDGPCSAEKLSDRLSLKHYVRANNLLGCAGHKVFNASPKDSRVRSWRRSGGWYNVIAPGEWASDNKFYWYIRAAIQRAFTSLCWDAPLRKNETIAVADFDPRFEGAKKRRLMSARERDPQLKAACIRIHGYNCSICGINLGTVYGQLGRNFIQVHHLESLSSRKAPSKTDPMKDLIPVCPNCHSIIHRGRRVRSPREVKAALKKAEKQR
jgi:predicted HNH restriction endonuclease